MTWLGERRTVLPDLSDASVLEVGSFDENGSARSVFERYVHDYVGIDAREGRGVDQVMLAHDLKFPTWQFDLVICTEMLEHDARPWLSVTEMSRVLKRGGSLLMTARGFDAYGGYPEHPCPKDYWRYNPDSFEVLLAWSRLRPIQVIPDPEVPGVFGHAVKP
jgi:SAM-dependent methyltransferase